jgi:phosphate acyltransferase
MGLNGLIIKSHGGATSKGFASTICVAYDMAQNDLAGKIMSDLKNSDYLDEEILDEMNIEKEKE